MTPEIWSPISDDKEHAVIRSPQMGSGPPTFDQLRGTHQGWIRAWCPSWQLACEIAESHNRQVDSTMFLAQNF